MREVWVSTDVTSEPVSSAEAKLFAKIPSTADDTVVTYLTKAAREAVEQYTGCSLASKTLVAQWDELPEDNVIELPFGPVSSVTSVVVVDEDGTETALTTADDEYYDLGGIWKKLQINDVVLDMERLKVTYVAGYGATGCPTLPSALKTAVLKEMATQYEFRENINVGNLVTRMTNSWEKLAMPHRRGI